MDPDHMAFTNKWPINVNHIMTTLALHEKDADFFTCFSDDIEKVLAVLKLLTKKPNNRNGKRNNDDWFQKLVDDFIIFLPVSITIFTQLYFVWFYQIIKQCLRFAL